MNVELLRKVADAIERQQVNDRSVGLNMQAWHGVHHPCGTSACVAGYVDLIVNEGRQSQRTVVLGIARASLDLTFSQSQELFFGLETGLRQGVWNLDILARINRSEHLVPTALRWMADTGRIEWDAALDYACSVKEKTDADS